MSDRTQDLTNHRKVATACKNYTDTQIAQAKEEIYWHIGEYSVTTSDDNTSASVKTVPANATRCKIKRVYGNTQKLNPTTASDSTSAMMKTMPSTVYDFDVSKVEGASYKYNQLVLDTFHNYNYSLNQWGSEFLTDDNLIENHKYLLTYKVSSFTSGNLKICFGNLSSQPNAFTKTIDENTTLNTAISSVFTANSAIAGYKASLYNLYTTSAVGTIAFVNIFDLTVLGIDTTDVATATTELLKRGIDINQYNEYNTGEIRNFAWTGVKVEGANLFDKDNYSYQNAYYDNNGNLNSANNTSMNDTPINVLANTQYTFKVSTTIAYFGVCFFNGTTFISRSQSNNTDTLTFITPNNCNYIYIYANYNGSTISANYISTIEPMLVRGTTVPTEYQPYITPTTLPIDLSTILYNGSPLFEENSLKAVNDVKDSITPYKATKNVGQILGSTYESNIITATTSGGLTCVVIQTNVNLIVNNQDTIVQLNNLGLTAMSASSQWTTTATNVIACNNQKRILINFDQSLTESEMIAKAKTLILNFAILTPIEVSINWASTLRGITGYSNGTITLLNTNNMDSANTITYNSIIKENCCAKMVQSRNGSVIKTINFPTQASDGWSAGSVANVRDFTNNTRTPYVDKVDLGTLSYERILMQDDRYRFTAQVSNINTSDNFINLLCYKYKTIISSSLFVDMTDKSIKRSTSEANINIIDVSYSDATVFKNAMSGTYLYYEKATSTSTAITAIENIIEVQAGDELAFYDSEDNLVTVPSDLTYRIEVAN